MAALVQAAGIAGVHQPLGARCSFVARNLNAVPVMSITAGLRTMISPTSPRGQSRARRGRRHFYHSVPRLGLPPERAQSQCPQLRHHRGDAAELRHSQTWSQVHPATRASCARSGLYGIGGDRRS